MDVDTVTQVQGTKRSLARSIDDKVRTVISLVRSESGRIWGFVMSDLNLAGYGGLSAMGSEKK